MSATRKQKRRKKIAEFIRYVDKNLGLDSAHSTRQILDANRAVERRKREQFRRKPC